MSFSIITTVLNGEKFIADCIESVQKQKYSKSLEHIIVDGGSSDNTISIVKKLSKEFKNIILISKQNIGIYQGINIGIDKARNKFLAILNSDDFYISSDVFESLELVFNNNPNISAVHSNVMIYKRNDLNKIYRIFNSKEFFPEDFLKCKHPPHTSLFIKKEIYQELGKFNEKLQIASDFEFMLRVFGKNRIKSKFIDKIFVGMRSHGTSTKNLKNILISNNEVVKSFKLNNLKINYLYLILKIFKKLTQIKIW